MTLSKKKHEELFSAIHEELVKARVEFQNNTQISWTEIDMKLAQLSILIDRAVMRIFEKK